MTDQQITEVLAEWAAKVGQISNNARPAWVNYLRPLQESTAFLHKVISKISQGYEKKGREGAKPTLQTLQDHYREASAGPATVRNFPSCSFCADYGIVYLIKAENSEAKKKLFVPKYATFASPVCDVHPIPCSCERGLQVHNKSFKYTHEQIREWAENYAYPAQKSEKTGNTITSSQVAWLWAVKFQNDWKAGNRNQSAQVTRCYTPEGN